jgi:hypothetical protein
MKKVTTLAMQQAELIIYLYELRREPVMRRARTYVGGEFLPASIDDLLVAMRNPEHSAYVLQVFGYWDMVAAMVFQGALAESFVYACCGEMYFQFAKIKPYIAEFRVLNSLPELFVNLERLTEFSAQGLARMQHMRTYLQISQSTNGAALRVDDGVIREIP